MENSFDRRNFLKTTGAAIAGIGMPIVGISQTDNKRRNIKLNIES